MRTNQKCHKTWLYLLLNLIVCFPISGKLITIPDNSLNTLHKYGLKGPIYKLAIIDSYRREYIFNNDRFGQLNELLFYNSADDHIPTSVTTWDYNDKIQIVSVTHKSYSIGQHTSSLYTHHEEKYDYDNNGLLSRYRKIYDIGEYYEYESAYIHFFTYDSLEKLIHYINYTNKYLPEKDRTLIIKNTFSEKDYLLQSSKLEKETEIHFFMMTLYAL